MTDITPTPARPSASTPQFPVEVVDSIIFKVERSQLPITIHISKSFRSLSAPRLYSSIVMNVRCDNTGDREKLVAAAGQLPRFLETSAAGMEGAASIAGYWFLTPPIPLLLSDNFIYIARLCLESHHPDKCSAVLPISLHHLDTLQITSRSTSVGRLDACHDSNAEWSERSDDESTPSNDDPIPATCRYLANLRPRQVIIGTAYATLEGVGAGLWSSDSPFPPPWLKELVIIVGSSPIWAGRSFLHNLPDTVKRLTLVFQPFEGETKWVPEVDQFRQDLWYDSDGNDIDDGEEKATWELLARTCVTKAEVTEVVGWETVDTGWTRRTVEKGWKRLRRIMVKICVGGGMSSDEAKLKAERVMVIERGIWEERERKRQAEAARRSRY